MPTSLFLSHSHKDQKQAASIRDLLRSVSAGQLDVWFSSNTHPDSGLEPGDWYQQIKTKLAASKTLIALVTPTSIDNRWMHFESGIAEALGVTVIPVCAGLQSLNEVPPPLNRYQAYQLSDYEALKTFVGKLFKLHGLELYESVASQAMRDAIPDFAVVKTKVDAAPQIKLEDAVELLKAHIDQRLLGPVGEPKRSRARFIPYALDMLCEKTPQGLVVTINIEEETTIQDVLDNTYFGISRHVTAYTYLSKWLVQERSTARRLVIREFSSLIPAHYVFRPGDDWRIILLSTPYRPSDSDEAVRELRDI